MKRENVATAVGAGIIAIGIAGFYGQQALSRYLLSGEHFAPIAPGQVNLVGIKPGAGYRIIVANDIAQLVETQGDFKGNESESGGATEGSIKKRVPIKELLSVLRGDGKQLGPFVMIMNGLQEKEDWSPIRVNWKSEDIEKAIQGDTKLKAKLERDLNVRLDGTPITPLNRNSLENGIFILAPVELTVNIDGKDTVVQGETIEPYKPGLMKAVESHYQDKSNITPQMIAGYYGDEAGKAIADKSKRENVAANLRRLYSKETMESRLETPRRMLSNATIVVNEKFVDDASYKSQLASDKKTYSDLTIHLNDEGRRRLWKYSNDKVGSQILLIANNVAIAAPRINHELALSEFTITQMPDEVLVREAVQSIKDSKGASSTK